MLVESFNFFRAFSWQLAKLRRQRAFNKIARHVYANHAIDQTDPISDRPKVRSALMCMIRGEDDYLVEWIEFHRILGVEHFFIYDNAANEKAAERTKDLLSPFIDQRCLTYIRWPDIPNLRDYWDRWGSLSLQQLAYGDCIRRFRSSVDWFLKFDVDEFMFPIQEHHSTLSQVLDYFDSEEVMGFSIRRTEFGSNGHVAKPTGLVIENFFQCAAELGEDTKGGARTQYIANDLYSMAFEFNYGLKYRIRRKLLGAPLYLQGNSAERVLQVNHYDLKSHEEYMRKKAVNASGYMAGKETEERFKALDKVNSVRRDERITRFITDVKSAIGR